MKRSQQLRVEVETSPQPIDLAQWARTYVRYVLALEGVVVRDDQPPVRTTLAEAG